MGSLTGQMRALSAPQPLSDAHKLDQFDSGVPALDAWLRARARANEAAGASRTFVICERDLVLGYYSLAAASIMHSHTTPRARRNMPDPVPAVLIGRLALDSSVKGRGHGVSLLRDAVLRVMAAAETVGVRAILVHAMSEEARIFYERFGFRRSPVEPMTLMMTVDEVRKLIG